MAARDGRGPRAWHELQSRQLHAAGETGPDEADPHVPGCIHGW